MSIDPTKIVSGWPCGFPQPVTVLLMPGEVSGTTIEA
jgi:hypothetical protein